MDLICKVCGKRFYLSEHDLVPNIEDTSCDACSGELTYLIELKEENIQDPVETGTVVDYEEEIDESDPKPPMTF